MVAKGYGFTLDFGTLGHVEPIRNSAGEPFRVDGYPLELKVLYNLPTPRDNINKKEKAMRKTEAKEQLEKLQVEVDRLREIVEQEDKKPWRADDNGEYYFISGGGRVARGLDLSYDIDDQRYAKGNYFQTEEEVKALLIYKVLNDKWHYWVAGVNDKPNEIPEGCEFCIGGSWLDEGNDPRTWDYMTRRWPKHS